MGGLEYSKDSRRIHSTLIWKIPIELSKRFNKMGNIL